jgi:hypothetical protein
MLAEKVADVLDGISWKLDSMTSMTWMLVAPRPKTATAMTVASRKPSHRPWRQRQGMHASTASNRFPQIGLPEVTPRG